LKLNDNLIARLGLLWGDGFLSPGGAAELLSFSKGYVVHRESTLIRGSLKSKALELLGAEACGHWLEVRGKEDIVLDKGELRPTHLRARRPG